MNSPGSPRGEYIAGEGDGDGDLELSGLDDGEWSGLLAGVAVGENIGVGRVDGVTALIPLSFNILANPRAVEYVEVEFRLERWTGVGTAVLMRLLLAVHIWLPRRL